jgi:hypothetical protein
MNSEISDNEMVAFLELLEKNKKLEQFFKIMDIMLDDNVKDDDEIDIDALNEMMKEAKEDDKPDEQLEVKNNKD